jgi:hypothetical protein
MTGMSAGEIGGRIGILVQCQLRSECNSGTVGERTGAYFE